MASARGLTPYLKKIAPRAFTLASRADVASLSASELKAGPLFNKLVLIDGPATTTQLHFAAGPSNPDGVLKDWTELLTCLLRHGAKPVVTLPRFDAERGWEPWVPRSTMLRRQVQYDREATEASVRARLRDIDIETSQTEKDLHPTQRRVNRIAHRLAVAQHPLSRPSPSVQASIEDLVRQSEIPRVSPREGQSVLHRCAQVALARDGVVMSHASSTLLYGSSRLIYAPSTRTIPSPTFTLAFLPRILATLTTPPNTRPIPLADFIDLSLFATSLAQSPRGVLQSALPNHDRARGLLSERGSCTPMNRGEEWHWWVGLSEEGTRAAWLKEASEARKEIMPSSIQDQEDGPLGWEGSGEVDLEETKRRAELVESVSRDLLARSV